MTSQFLDNVGIKNPKTTFNNEKTAFKIHHYMLKHIQFLDKTFADIAQTGAITAKTKPQFYISRLKIVSYFYDTKKRYPNMAKILKVFD